MVITACLQLRSALLLAELVVCCDAAKLAAINPATALLAVCALSTAVMGLACRFHEIQPQTGLKMLPPGASSRKIVSAIPKSVPYPVLQENTLVLSNFLVVGKRNGKLSLMFRRAFLTQHAYMLPVSGCSDSNAMSCWYAGLVQMKCVQSIFSFSAHLYGTGMLLE